MIELLKQEIVKYGDQATIVPINRLYNIQQDIKDLKGSGILNDFQQYIVNDLYMLDVPETDFEIRSILTVASPSPSSAKITFTWKGKSIPLMLPAAYVDNATTPTRIEHYLNAFLNPRGHHVQYAPRLPRKLLAVRSGLGMYGRNNLCYVEGMGSFLNLAPYFSDIPCMEERWYDIHHLDACNKCQACLHSCPTAAITQTRFLINNERCLTYFNEAGGEWDFPEWIDPSSHHTLYGCSRCQTVCPMNKPYLNNTIEPADFTEEETAFLLEGKSFELFPETLKQKINVLDMVNYLGALPRNLRVLFDKDAS